jgi:hypothetical protein
MIARIRRTTVLAVLSATLIVGGSALAKSESSSTGPSSSATPYLVPVQPGVEITSILTVGDSVNTKADGSPYRMVGIPDGLGAFDNGDGTFTLLMNHELVNTVGAVRAHGAKGAFVSRWTISKRDLTVIKGEDLMQQVVTWNPTTSSYNVPAKGIAFSRFCSADLPEKSAFYDDGVGYNGRLFMNGEESGSEGRALAHAMDGTTYELPRLGKFSWENSLANPESGHKTVVVGTNDGTGGQVFVYVGTKTNSGSPVDRAGLTNGTLYGVKVDGFPAEVPATGIPSGTHFTLVNLGNVENLTGAQLLTLSRANGITEFQRPEDGAWDPAKSRNFYFNTTASFTGNSRLWRLNFRSVENPTRGGTIDLMLDGSEGQKMLDNMAISEKQMVLLEDPGNQAYVSKVYSYNRKSDVLTTIAQHDPARFAPGAANFLTQDEESSGVIDISKILGKGKFLLVTQAHYSTDAELVEGGQLMLLQLPKGEDGEKGEDR